MTDDTALFKETVQHTFPSDRRDILYIYEFFGRVLFPDWDTNPLVRPFDATQKRFWGGVCAYHEMIQAGQLTDAQRTHCINFIFSESVRRLGIADSLVMKNAFQANDGH